MILLLSKNQSLKDFRIFEDPKNIWFFLER